MSQVDWRNRTYTSSCWAGWSSAIPATNQITVKNGSGWKWQRTRQGESWRLDLYATPTLRYDLTRDGHQEQVVGLSCGAGGNYHAQAIQIYTSGANGPLLLATLDLNAFNWYHCPWYQPKVFSSWISGGKLRTTVYQWTPDDAMLAPSHHVDVTWAWNGHGFSHTP